MQKVQRDKSQAKLRAKGLGFSSNQNWIQKTERKPLSLLQSADRKSNRSQRRKKNRFNVLFLFNIKLQLVTSYLRVICKRHVQLNNIRVRKTLIFPSLGDSRLFTNQKERFGMSLKLLIRIND